MNNYSENSETLELTIEEFDTAKLPSLEDLMRELNSQETAIEPAAIHPPKPAAIEPENARARERLERIEAEKAALSSNFERVAQDFEKYRWRAERERSEHYAFAVISIVQQFLPVLDNFERALSSVAATENQNFQQFVSGVEMIYQQNVKFLADIGVQQMKSVGAEFNPRFHEAVTTEARADVAPNTILEELMRGYQMGDKLVRPAMVKVSVKEEE